MYDVRMSSQTITITTKALATKAGFDIPAALQRVADDYLLVFDGEDNLVAYGPERDRETVLGLARLYQ